MTKIFVAVAFLGASISAHADPSRYICVTEQSVGLHYNKQSQAWSPTSFAANRKYVLRQLNDDDRKQWSVLIKSHPKTDWAFFEIGNDVPIALCTDDLLFSCAWGSMIFDKSSLRFERANYGGYTSQGYWEKLRSEKSDQYDSGVKYHRAVDPDKPDDLFFEIGKCSPF
jgi:hypothetical protein